jgi:fluoroacetyl-CoA thioesterase
MTTLSFTVSEQDTALALGSGDVPVLATPRILAWMEAATVAAASSRLDSGSTSVGIEVFLTHGRASGVGARIDVEVTSVTEQDRGLTFEVVARERARGSADPGGVNDGAVVASGRVVRAVVDRQRFLSRL